MEKPVFLTDHLAGTGKTNITTTEWQHKKTQKINENYKRMQN